VEISDGKNALTKVTQDMQTAGYYLKYCVTPIKTEYEEKEEVLDLT
jgi:hypothetical protein